MASPSEAAAAVLALALARDATLGNGRLVCLDGPAGSGKTTLAAAVAAAHPGTHVVHMDDLYDGWDGLPRITDQLERLLRPLAAGRPGSYRRYDWVAGSYAETVTVEPVPLLVLEGVASGARSHTDLTTVLAWVSAPADLRLARGLERDGVELTDRWRQWMLDEAALFAVEETERRADLRVDGTGVTPPQAP
ncbi:uridine kinase [Nocardioides ginsengisegetis]|uniref:Uridine kinase n=1 Tax=Nocardioides ginsengisegetis TaxID=661491 RepID=A0A7W3P970_9ACTN|nr:4-amino-4-deoxy-L-arabinose transferase [Nocardioides ginsengisegetis]MBA8803126.1 uridine kinase [Nocardioides ginsengisegetis]